MFPYIVIFVLNLLPVVFFGHSKTLYGKFYMYGILIIDILFVGLRDMIGGFDVYVYAQVYESSTEFILNYEPFEISFRYILIFFKFFSDSRLFFFLSCSIITFWIHSQVIQKYSNQYFFAFFLFFSKFFLLSFIYLRQELAICVSLLSLTFIIKRKPLIFLLIVIFAASIHTSAYIFLPTYFLANYKFERKGLVFIVILFILMAATPLSDFFLTVFVDSYGNDKVSSYFANSSALNIFYLIEVLTYSLFLYFFKEELYLNQKGKLIFNGWLFYILIILLSIKNATFVRFAWFYNIFLFLGLAQIFHLIQYSKNRNLFISLVLIGFGTIFFRFLILFDSGDLIPYKSVFENFKRDGMWESLEYK